MIDLFLVSGITYTVYIIVKSILNNDITWITYKPKHKKRNRFIRLLEEES